MTIVSGNTRPVITIAGPPDGGFFQFGDQIKYDLTVNRRRGRVHHQQNDLL